MRRFIITSTASFKGSAELVFNTQGVLMIIDLSNAQMDKEIIKKFKAFAPEHVSDIAKFNSTSATVIEADFEVSFQMFWVAYNHKINRKRCEQLWASMHKEKQVKAWAGVAAYDKFLKSTGFRKKADPETYLRNEFWENEYNN